MNNNNLSPVATALAVSVLTTVAVSLYAFYGNKRERSGAKASSSSATVKEINIYPIKSCVEIQVENATITSRGFRHDRSFQVVSKVDNVWSYCTPRDKTYEKLFHIKPTLIDGGTCLKLTSPHTEESITIDLQGASTTSLVTTTMGDDKFTLEDYGDEVSGWLRSAIGVDGLRLVGVPRNNFKRQVQVNPDQGEDLPTTTPIPLSLADEAPFLLTTNESLDALNKRLVSDGKSSLDMRRFRPNIVIEGLQPWEEDSLKRIKIGSAEFLIWQRCGRCAMTTIDRDTLKRGGEPISTLGKFRQRGNQRNFGMHMIPVLNDGVDENDEVISVGDKVEVLEYDKERLAEWARLFGK